MLNEIKIEIRFEKKPSAHASSEQLTIFDCSSRFKDKRAEMMKIWTLAMFTMGWKIAGVGVLKGPRGPGGSFQATGSGKM